ncbi:MAG: Mycothiol acetyltransferase [Calditrichaeota bacterium]|nr:Mycothiol acetyltransferase [Calditrichota bacterium]
MSEKATAADVEFYRIDSYDDFPQWATDDFMVEYFHETMKPYNDTKEDVRRALDYAFKPGYGQGGFLNLVHRDEKLLGACLMLRTGMKGYVPEWILLMVTVSPETRGQGIGAKLIQRCFDDADGDVKLHVEYDNPAKRLYERLGMTTKYAEMRYYKNRQ